MFSDGFIWFGNHGVRPALISLFLYLLLMGGFLIFGNCCASWEKQSRPVLCRKSLLYILLLALFFIIQFYQGNTVSEETWISNVLENYLKIEDLLVAVLFLGTVLGCTFRENSHQFLDVVLKIVRVVCIFSLYGNFLTGLCAFTFPNTVILISVWGGLIATAGCTIVSSGTDDTKKSSNYAPIESYEDLSDNFKRIADRLVSIVETDTSSTYSICLAGDWGMGKTSIIHGVEHRLKERTKQCEEQKKDSKKVSKEVHYKFIYINALELDTAESLFHYLFSRIKQILKEEGVYVGLGSTYRKFIGSAVDTITQSSLSILLEGELFAQNEDYRVQKKALSALIARAMNNGRIIVVVDDIERCHKDKIKDYLFFVKEIASMERCVPIFVTDYNRLVEQIKERDENPHVFLDKFFNYTVHVACSAVEDVIVEMQKELDKVVAVTAIPYIQKANIEDIIKKCRKIMTSLASSKQEKDNNTKSEAGDDKEANKKINKETLTPQEKISNKFQSDMNNTRTVVHVCTKMIHYYEVVGNQYGSEQTRVVNVLDTQIEKYGKQIHLHNVIFFIAYVECCMPLEFSRMAKSCYDYVHHQKDETEQHLEVLVMVRKLLCENGAGEANAYADKAIEFLSTLLSKPEKLLDIVDWDANEIEKGRRLLLEEKFDLINSDWGSLVRRLLQNQYFSVGAKQKEDEKVISNLIEYLKYKLDKKQITSRNILEQMMMPYFQKFFVSRYGFMKKLKYLMINYPISISREEELYRGLNYFKVTYVWTWFDYYRRLIEFTAKDGVNWKDSIDVWTHDYRYQDVKTDEFIDEAIDKIQSQSGLNYVEKQGAINGLRSLTEALSEQCAKSKKYPEIAYNLSYVRCAVSEIESWMEMENAVIKDDAGLQRSDYLDIGRWVQYFQKKQLNDFETRVEFDDFIMSLEDRTVEATNENKVIIWRLHELLTRYLEENKMVSTKYRRIVCNFQRRMSEGAEETYES